MANLISAGLFGDGAAAVIVAGAECGLSGPEILATRSVFYPNTEEMMGWDISEKGFRIVLSREIPDLVRKNLAHDLDDFLAERGLTRADIGSWVLHTGGPKILEATADALGLKNGELEVSWQCLRRTGNLVVGFGAGGARRSHEESPPGARHARFAGRDGARILLGIRFAEMVGELCRKAKTWHQSNYVW